MRKIATQFQKYIFFGISEKLLLSETIVFFLILPVPTFTAGETVLSHLLHTKNTRTGHPAKFIIVHCEGRKDNNTLCIIGQNSVYYYSVILCIFF